MRAPLLSLSAVLVSALALAACGGDDETTTTTTTPAATGATGAASPADAGAADVEAQSAARTAQTAIETYFVENQSYTGADPEVLAEIDPSLPGDIEVDADDESFSITAPSESGNSFTLERDKQGTVTYPCTDPGVGECGEDGEWD